MGHPELLGTPPQLLLGGSGAHEHQLDRQVGQVGHGLDERHLPLLRAEASHADDDLLTGGLGDRRVGGAGTAVTGGVQPVGQHHAGDGQPAVVDEDPGQVLGRRQAGVALVGEGRCQAPPLTGQGHLHVALVEVLDGLPVDAGKDRQRLERHWEGDGQGQQARDHGQRVVVDELGVEGVDGGDVRDVLTLGHPVRQDPQAELSLAVDDVEVVGVEAPGQAGIDGGDLAAVEDVVARGGQADDVVVGLLMALGLGGHHVDLVSHALQGSAEGGCGGGHAVDGGEVVVDEEGDPHVAHLILWSGCVSSRPVRGSSSGNDDAGGNMGRVNLAALGTRAGVGSDVCSQRHRGPRLPCLPGTCLPHGQERRHLHRHALVCALAGSAFTMAP